MEDISINPVISSTSMPLIQQSVMINKAETVDMPKTDAGSNGKSVIREEKNTANISEIVNRVKEFVNTFTTKLTFDIDPVTNDSVIYVRDNETGKIIRQIPPEEMNKLLSSMEEITGILFNRRV